MPDPIPCIIYAARSAEDEREGAEKSTTNQTEEVLARIEQEGDRTVVGEFAESGHSGYHGERGPELKAAMEAAIAAAAEHGRAELWVFVSSRLSRGDGKKGRASLLGIYARMVENDVELRSVTDDEFVRNPMLVGIAGVQNHKYSKDHGANVARGKAAAMREGKWAGGAVPDGYLAESELDARGDKISWLVIDPERAPVIAKIFELSEEGVGQPTIARRMNDAGFSTGSGKVWYRRQIQAILTNPIYAGRITRRGKGSPKQNEWEPLAEPEVYEGQHEPIIDPDRFDRIAAAAQQRDHFKDRGKTSSPADRGKRGGRPTTNFALAKLAICDRCGARMYATTSPYKRKDGTQKRTYLCANAKFATGLCKAPPVDARLVDEAVVDYLNRLFVDVEAWASELANGIETKRAGLKAAAEVEAGKVKEAKALLAKAKARYRDALKADDDGKATRAEELMDEADAEIIKAKEGAADAEAKLAQLADEPTPTDSALDLQNELRAVVLGGDGTLLDLNDRLRQEFTEFRLATLDPGTVAVQPVLKAREFDVGAALAAYVETQGQAPSPEEVAAYRALERQQDSILVGSTPPTLPLEVAVAKPPYQQL